MKKVVFLASGNGGTLKFTHFALQKFDLDFKIIAVIADRECGALEFASKADISNHNIEYSRKNPSKLQELLIKIRPDVIVTNFHKIIDEETLGLYPNSFINLHYSILPAFGGLIGMKTIDEAEKVNSKFVGATCHTVIPEVDAGKIISQCSVPVNWNIVDKPTLIETVFRSACLTFLNGLIESINESETSNINGFQVQFNPGLIFNSSLLDEDFWNQLKMA